MPADPYAYALIRVVPRVERGECLNAGVILYSRPHRFLGGHFELNEERLRVLAPELDLAGVARQVAIMNAVIAGDPVGGGAIATLPPFERFGWLSAPASTVVQPGPVHAGLTDDPAQTLDHLFATLVQTG